MNKINYKKLTNSSLSKLSNFMSESKFKYVVIDNFLKKDVAKKIESNFKLNSKWTNYSLINNYKKYGLNDKSVMSKNLLRTIDELGEKKFLKILTKITNINDLFLDHNLDGAGLHQVYNKGYLNIHTDFASHHKNLKWKRVINLLIYFNNDWKDQYGGNLELYDKHGKKILKSIAPKFNRAVIFITNNTSYHGHTKKLKLPKNVSRKSLALYYYVNTRKIINSKSTKYISKKNDTILFKALINFENYLLRLFDFLKRMNIMNDKSASKILNIFK